MAIWPKGRVALMLSLCLLLVTIAKTLIAFGRYAKAEKSFASVQIEDSLPSVIGRMGKANYHEVNHGVL